MHRHWENAIRPLLAALDSGPIVEIGAAAGETTVGLAEFAAERGLVLHSVDPAPELDVAALERRFGDGFRFHRQRSFEALEAIEAPAAALIDGDHNWYTVHGELTRLEQAANAAGRPFPLTVLHDVEWPYARRDMYYEPEAIPAEWRRPWDRRGIRWGASLLDEGGRGVNAHLANALEEGGPRNGVLTAVEDFVEESQAPLDLRVVHGHAGLGVLVSRRLLDSKAALRSQWERLHSPQFLLGQARMLSDLAAQTKAAEIDAAREVGRLRRELEEARGNAAARPGG